MGAQNARMVESQTGIYDDEDKTAYVRRIGNRLVAQLDKPLFDYKFNIVEDMSPNAFALPGGYLYVTTGLIPILKSEDELACILGHEIIHSNNRHAVKKLRMSILPRLLELPGELLGVIDKDLGAIFNAPITTSNALIFASYGRGNETESDEEGIELAAKAGYDPNAMTTALSRLSKTVEVATDQKEEKSYFNSHPYTPDRVSAIEEKISEMNFMKKTPDSKNYLMEFDGILFGESPSKGVVSENKFLHPDLNFFIEFPKDWAINNQPSNVGAYNERRDAAAFVTFDDPSLTPNEAGQKFLSELKSEHKSKIVGAENYVINDKDGYLISFEDVVKSETMYAYVLWIPLQDKLFKLMGIAPIKHKTDLERTSLSLRVLTNEEKESFTIKNLHIVSANQGETTQTLSKRVGNELNIELTNVINSKKSNQKLIKGELIKVVNKSPYKIK